MFLLQEGFQRTIKQLQLISLQAVSLSAEFLSLTLLCLPILFQNVLGFKRPYAFLLHESFGFDYTWKFSWGLNFSFFHNFFLTSEYLL